MKNILYFLIGALIFINCEKDKTRELDDPQNGPTFRIVELSDCEINWTAYVGKEELIFVDTLGTEYEFKVELDQDFWASKYYKNDSVNIINEDGIWEKIYVNFSLTYLTIDLLSQGEMINYLGIKGVRFSIENKRKRTENINDLVLEIWELLDLPGSGSTTLDNLMNTSILDCELEDNMKTTFHVKKTIANKEFWNVYSGVMARTGLTVFVNNEFGIVGLSKNGKELHVQ